MLAKKRQFTEIFQFEAYHRSEKLVLTKENEYDFYNHHPKIIQLFTLPTLKILLASVTGETFMFQCLDLLCSSSILIMSIWSLHP